MAMSAFARRSDTILEQDPNGLYVTLVSVVVVLVSLIVLCVLIYIFGRIMVRSARKKAALVKGVAETEAICDSVVNGELIAAIALALKLNKREQHDEESAVITINKVARVYSPWSSKIHGLTHMPERIRK